MTKPLIFPRCQRRLRSGQRGVVLFVALIAMVVLSLTAVALLRSIDTNTSVAGNLAFRQASIAPVNNAIEKANDDMFYAKNIADLFNSDLNFNYYANLQVGESTGTAPAGIPKGVPAALQGPAPPPLYPGSFQTLGPDGAGNTVRWVIERVCTNGTTGDPVINVATCDLLTPKVAAGKTTMKLGGLPVPPIPIYRVTVRVDGPANTVTYAQAMLR
ncbi:MAG TPA: hypothetical protein VF814_17875 [Casimicrobiaceae bacterium]